MSFIFGSQERADVLEPNMATPFHGTAPDGTGSPSTLMLVQLLSLGPGSGLADEIHLLLRTIPACQQLILFQKS
eukprot:1156961-Pelagomonas_calceolata.AAC.12